MSDDRTKTALGRKLISLDEPHEVRCWTASLGASEIELRFAIRAVGSSAHRVRAYLAAGDKRA